MAKYLLDTATVIAHLRGSKKVNFLLEEIGQRGDIAGCCCINIVETYAGMREDVQISYIFQLLPLQFDTI